MISTKNITEPESEEKFLENVHVLIPYFNTQDKKGKTKIEIRDA
jgi:hypothetical protein